MFYNIFFVNMLFFLLIFLKICFVCNLISKTKPAKKDNFLAGFIFKRDTIILFLILLFLTCFVLFE